MVEGKKREYGLDGQFFHLEDTESGGGEREDILKKYMY